MKVIRVTYIIDGLLQGGNNFVGGRRRNSRLNKYKKFENRKKRVSSNSRLEFVKWGTK